MELSYTMKEMDNILDELRSNNSTYKESIDSLKTIIESLGKIWHSSETGSYEEYQKLFQEKYQKLLEVETLIQKGINTLEKKKNDYQEASEKVIESFE